MNERSLSYSFAFVWTFGASALILAGIGLTEWFKPHASSDIVNVGAWHLLSFLLASFGLVRVYAARRSSPDAFGLRRTHLVLPVLGLALGFTLYAPIESLRGLIEKWSPTPASDLAAEAALLSTDTPARTVLVVAVAACVMPLAEELFFQGALFGALRRSHPPLGAAVIAALSFVISHIDLREWLPSLTLAVVLSHLRLVSGSLLPPLAVHVGFNATTIVVVLTGFGSVSAPTVLPRLVNLASWAMVGTLVYGVQRLALASPEAAQARAQDTDE